MLPRGALIVRAWSVGDLPASEAAVAFMRVVTDPDDPANQLAEAVVRACGVCGLPYPSRLTMLADPGRCSEICSVVGAGPLLVRRERLRTTMESLFRQSAA